MHTNKTICWCCWPHWNNKNLWPSSSHWTSQWILHYQTNGVWRRALALRVNILVSYSNSGGNSQKKTMQQNQHQVWLATAAWVVDVMQVVNNFRQTRVLLFGINVSARYLKGPRKYGILAYLRIAHCCQIQREIQRACNKIAQLDDSVSPHYHCGRHVQAKPTRVLGERMHISYRPWLARWQLTNHKRICLM
jgi:hypothetical protein